ncbi:MAG TPA: DPP IV N-terminal domain-containing protein [Fimbriiglobus sp.]|jgi:dienelactone hydrolase
MTRRLLFAAAFLAAAPLFANDPAPVPISGANYPLAGKFNREFIGELVHEANVSPQWIGKTDQFWYSIRTERGMQYWRVDAVKRTKAPLFDAEKLTAGLSEAAKKPLDAATLVLSQVKLPESGKTMTFVYGPNRYEFEFESGNVKLLGKAPAPGGQIPPQLLAQMTEDQRIQFFEQRRRQQERQQNNTQQQGTGTPARPATTPQTGYKNYSPDKKKFAFAKNHNLYIADEGAEDKAVQLTKDGEENYSFAGGFGGGRGGRGGVRGGGGQQRGGVNGTGTGRGRGARGPASPDAKVRANVTWSSDSKYFYVIRTDSRGIKDLYLVDSLAQPRPRLEEYQYPMPGEDNVRKMELFTCDAAKKTLTRLPQKWKDERFSAVEWGKKPDELRFIRRDRLLRDLDVCSFDVAKNSCKCLIAEGFEAAYLESQPIRYVEESDDMIWWSERSGWAHYYRYSRDGKLKNAITTGSWRTSTIVEVDGKNGILFFKGNAREPGENPYYQHLYRVRLDGTELTLLDPSQVPDGKGYKTIPGGLNHTSYLSPSKKYVVDTASAVDHEPIAILRDDRGTPLMTLETTDLSRLKKTGWKMPETFSVKAADGMTDLYGNMWKPFDFDPKKKYPIIAHVYPGPQTEGVTYRFASYGTNQQLAQLGFVVIQVGHRGGSPERSKAYHSFGYFNLRDYGLADKKAAIEQLAARFNWIDIDRVGIYGHSGGGFMSAAALLVPPYNTFFKAAVASSGNHDNNIYNDQWSEKYHGLKEVPADQAKTLAENTTGTQTGTTGRGGRGGRGGVGGRGRGGRGGGGADPKELEAEILSLIDIDVDPDDTTTIEQIEKKITELNKQLADLKKDDGKTDDKKSTEKKAVTTATKTAEKKTDDKTKTAEKKEPPKTVFQIHIPTNAELAANLKGHLLLVHGEIDNNVHPANTMRLVDALIKANKRFDMLIIPGARHGYAAAQPYFTQKMWDFFSEYLLNDKQMSADINEKDPKRK